MSPEARQGWLRTTVMAAGLVAAIALITVALLVAHGFRASDRVPAWQNRVARSLRNLAIPVSERHRTNPVAGSADSIDAGQQLYLQHCSQCHGVDGAGRTPLGTSLYPRSPDLRNAEAQALSDGALHYIIRHGVQHTGMPALADNNGSAESQTWQIVTFLRTLRPLSGAEQRNVQHAIAGAHYSGSASCQRCHAAIYQHWQSTPMANVVRDPRQHPDAILPDLKTNTIAPFTRDQVVFVYGSIWKQRYFARNGNDLYPLPVQWDIGNHKWLPYHVPDKGADWWAAFYPTDNRDRPTGPLCDGCHSVGYNIQTRTPAEWNVRCERCHGAGSEHVAHPTRSNILNPSHMDSVAESDICIQCHSQGRPAGGAIGGKYYDWPVGYKVGLKLADFWTLEDHTLGQTTFTHFADGSAHKNRMQGNDFVQSVMYRRGVTCSSCHDVHGTGNYAQLRKPANEICMDCHSATSPNGPHTATLEQHTHHAAGSTGSQCVACHMPKIAGEGVPGAFVTSHTFRFLTPSMTVKYGIPNPCTSCHKDRSNQWATDQLRGWKSASPWRVGE